MEPLPTKYARTFSCPSCGGSLEIKAPGHTIEVACQYCGSIIDVNTPEYKAIYKQKNARQPSIPLGTRGVLDGAEWEVIGMMIKKDEQWKFEWEELLLYNPRLGFRWLSQSDGHWLLVAPIHAQFDLDHSHMHLQWGGRSYKRYNRSSCSVEYVLGEFYWRSGVGDKAFYAEYVSAPFGLSYESTDEEQAWTIHRYVSRSELRKAFPTIEKWPPQKGIAPTQPNPHASNYRAMSWLATAGILLLFVLMIYMSTQMPKQKVLDQQVGGSGMAYQLAPYDATFDTTNTIISPSFQLKGDVDNVNIETDTELDNSWLEISYTLVNEETGALYELSSTIEYYHGYEGGESWSEGSNDESDMLNNVPAGTYHLEVQVAMPTGKYSTFRVQVIRGVMSYVNYFLGLLVLLVPYVWVAFSYFKFEKQRWSNAD